MLKALARRLGFHPRAWARCVLTYPRYLGEIRPELLRGSEAEIAARLSSLEKGWSVSHLSVPLGQRILFLAPHPDDESIGAGGLLLAHRGKAATHVINVFAGEGGGKLLDGVAASEEEYQSQLVSVRRAELKEAAKRIGNASVTQLDFPEGAGEPGEEECRRLRQAVDQVRPDVVILPWFLDNHPGHRVTNILYAGSCHDLDCMVFGCEIWSLCQPNAVLDITPWLEEKIDLVRVYRSQLATVDYVSYARGLALTRAFLHNARPGRTGAAEAFFALPNKDYCDLVRSLYGTPGNLTAAGAALV